MPLLRRTLLYHWRTNLAVLSGVVIATAVLAGALVVGDSVRGSLRALTLERLGPFDHALVSGRFVRQSLAGDLAAPARDAGFNRVVPAILVQGTVALVDDAGQKKAVARGVTVLGVDERFWGDESPYAPAPGSRWAVLGATVAGELGAAAGNTVVLTIERPSSIPRESLMGERDDVFALRRVEVKAVAPAEGLGRFGLHANQQLPKNVYLPLADLQQALDRDGYVNALLVTDRVDQAAVPVDEAAKRSRELDRFLRHAWQLDDLGLRIVPNTSHGYFSLESRETLLEPAVVEAAENAAHQTGLFAGQTLTYLANTIAVGRREIPYSTITALDVSADPPLGPFRLVGGQPPPPLKDAQELGRQQRDAGFEGEILLNKWAADDLQAPAGAAVLLRYFEVDARGNLDEVQKQFLLRGVVAIEGPAADHGLTPEFPGITDVQRLDQWDPPFQPFHFERIRRVKPNDQDEQYWDRYRATPKAFVGLATGQRLWSSRFGSVTSMRIAPQQGEELAKSASDFQRTLLQTLQPERLAIAFRPVKAEGLAAISGSADFGMLFLGFSFFLIGSAAMLVGLLFRLGVERRCSEIGILLATGFTPGRVRRLLLAEGAIVSGAGALIGLFAAVGYAALMLAGLRSPHWWLAAVQTPFIHLHLEDSFSGLLIGYVASVAVALIAIGVAVARLGRVAVRYLLAGHLATETQRGAARRTGRLSLTIAIVSFVSAIALIVAGAAGAIAPQGAFFGSGALLLVSGLANLRNMLSPSRTLSVHGGGLPAIAWLGVRNGARHPGRSLLVASLVASATFLIVAVATNRRDPTAEAPRFDSGNGGFALLARSSISFVHDLNTPGGRRALNIPEEAGAQLAGARTFPFRYQPSNDASCLNLYVPQKPPLLGAPKEFIDRVGGQGRGAFRFASTAKQMKNSWELLREPLQGGAIPVIGDMNTLMWTFHKGVGDEFDVVDDHGTPVKLRVVGMLQDSIFQSELVMSEENFLQHFDGGYRYFLVEFIAKDEAAHASAASTIQLLESHLADYGFDAKRTSEQIKEYLAVQNTYLSTFQALGGLGLLLGTLGLGAVLFRNVLERRGELALMRALGFRRSVLAWMVLAENGFLLVIGLVVGAVSALLAVAPHLLSAGADVPWTSLAATLGLVFVAGVASGTAAVIAALRTPLLPALRTE